MAINIGPDLTGPNGLPLLHLPRAPSPAEAPEQTPPVQPRATEPAATQAPPTAPDALDVLRNAPKRLATKAEIERLACKWSRS